MHKKLLISLAIILLIPIVYYIVNASFNSQANNSTLETRLWNLYSESNQNDSIYKRDYFHIDHVNESQTIALGSYVGSSGSNANIFAFRLNGEDQWTLRVTQEALLCQEIEKLSQDQIIFIKENGVKTCVLFDTSGQMRTENL